MARTVLKRLKVGQEFPRDFWNYNINPHLGYDEKKDRIHHERISRQEKKYEIPFITTPVRK